MRVRPQPAAPGQESVWDYPRPPRIEPAGRSIRVEHAGVVIASTDRAVRVLETSHPPTYYLPPDDVAQSFLRRTRAASFCEWKGQARYFDLVVDDATVTAVAWTYDDPSPRAVSLRHHLAFYAHELDACYVDGERARAQAGGFYGGWITSHVVGPFKGEAGTGGW